MIVLLHVAAGSRAARCCRTRPSYRRQDVVDAADFGRRQRAAQPVDVHLDEVDALDARQQDNQSALWRDRHVDGSDVAAGRRRAGVGQHGSHVPARRVEQLDSVIVAVRHEHVAELVRAHAGRM